MKIISPILNWITSLYISHWITLLKKWCIKNISLIVAIVALFIAIKSNNDANTQFKMNLESSDSLFKVQLFHSKNLNDSLIKQFVNLYEITDKQTHIIDTLLITSSNMFEEQIYAGRPIVDPSGITLGDIRHL